MRHLGLAMSILCVVLSGTTARAADPFPGGVQAVTLKNGLRLLLAPDDRATAVDLAVWYAAGTRYERAGITGISHLFEHLMFRGSAGFGPQEHRRLIQSEGGNSGAYTSADYTCFFETVPPEALELAIRLEADRMGALTLTQDRLEAERPVVRDEKARGSGSPAFDRGLELLYDSAFPSHPYRWPVFGLDADIPRLTLKDCIDYYKLRYTPQHVTVTVVGNFDPARAMEWAKHHFEAVKAGTRREPALRSDLAPAKGRRATERANLPSPLLLVGWRGPARGDPDWPALDLLSAILTGGPSSRLHHELVETRRSCLAVQGDLEGRRDGSLFYAAAAVPPGADTAAVERDLAAEIDRLVTEPVTDSELERVRNQAHASLLFSLQTARGRGQALGLFELLNGSYQDLTRHLERLRACTPADLQRAAARHLAAERSCVVWVTPAGDTSTTTAPTTGGGRP